MTVVHAPISTTVTSAACDVSAKGELRMGVQTSQMTYAMLEALRARMRCYVRELMPECIKHTPIQTRELENIPFNITSSIGTVAFNSALQMTQYPFALSVSHDLHTMHCTIDLLLGATCPADIALEYTEWLCVELRNKALLMCL